MATTSTSNLRKLIQTRLHQKEDHHSTSTVEDDKGSYFEEDDEQNPITRRLTLWLGPRHGSTGHNTVHSRSSSELRRLDSPLPPTTPHSGQQRVKACEPSTSTAHPLKPNNSGRYAKKQDPRSQSQTTLNDVPLPPLPARPSPHPINEAGSATSSFDGSSVPQGTHGVHDTRSTSPRPQTPLKSTTLSKPIEPVSSQKGSAEDTIPTIAETDEMRKPQEEKSGPATRRQTREWSDGVRQLIAETDQAFEGVGNSFGTNNLKAPRQSTDMSQSNPDLLSDLAPQPLVVEKHEKKEDVGPKAEAPLEIPQRRSSTARDAALIAERRKSRSVPPPIQVSRKASPPPPEEAEEKPPVPPKSDRDVPHSARQAPKSAREPPMSARERPFHKNSISHNETPPLKTRGDSISSTNSRTQRQAAPHGRRPSKVTRWGISETGSIRSVFKRNQVEELITPQEMEKLKLERDEAKFKSSISKLPRKFRESAVPGPRKGHRARPSQDSIPELADLLSEIDDEDDLGIPPQVAELSSSPVVSDAPVHSSQKSSASDDGDDCKQPTSSDEGSASKKCPTSDEEEDDYRPPVPPRKSIKRKSVGRGRQPSREESEEIEGLKTVDLMEDDLDDESDSAVPLPPKNPKRYTKELPALPERSSRRQTATTDNLKGEEDEEYYYLKSTPYSMTTPSFRQGPIAFPKSEIGKGVRKMDDTLDWTAFQMAIIGADEFLPDIYDDGDGKFADDLKTWFKGFGFDTYGELVPEDEPPSPRDSLDSGSSVASADNDLPIPAEDPATDLNEYDATKFFQGKGLKQWTMEGQQPKPSVPQKPNDGNRPTAANPVVVDNEDNKQASEHQEEASLGYNLNSDLGDFLKWEAQAFGGGYYGAH